MKRNSLKSGLIVMCLLSLAMLLSNCKGDKGDPGPATNGTNGTNGTKGTNGAGFDEAVKNGSIVVYLDGTRPDGIAFKDTLSFKFSPTSANYSSANVHSLTADYDVEFYVSRFMALDNYSHTGDAYAQIDFEPSINTETGDTVKYFDMYLSADVVTSDYKYFRISNTYSSNGSGSGNLIDSTFTQFKYDPTKGTLNYKFKFIVLAGNNSSGNDLKVSGAVNAIVYQNIGDNSCVECRKTERGNTAKEFYPVEKAKMMSLE